MSTPRMTSIFQEDLFYVFLYIHFGVGRDYIFKISTIDEKFSLYDSFIFRISNPFFGVTPISFKTPHCRYWCCVTVATYAEKSFLKFYEISKDSLSRPGLVPFGYSESLNKTLYSKENNLADYGQEKAFHTLYVLNISGKVEEIIFGPNNQAGSESIDCLILKSDGDIINITINRFFLIEIKNLYLSSRELQLDILGKVDVNFRNEEPDCDGILQHRAIY